MILMDTTLREEEGEKFKLFSALFLVIRMINNNTTSISCRYKNNIIVRRKMI